MTPVRVSGDVRLFVLGDEGVLFSESRQELYTLNSAATFLWCLLEDGLTVDDLVTTYAETFALTRPGAEAHVYPILRRWYGLGHIADPQLPGSGDMPLTVALACLLTNRELRAAFRGSPDATRAALGVEPDDRDAFLGLDPEDLDRLAGDIVDHRHRQRSGLSHGAVPLDLDHGLDAALRLGRRRADTASRTYRIIDTTFEITMPAALEAVVGPAFPHLQTAPTPATHVRLHVLESNAGCVIFEGALPLVSHRTPSMVAPSLKLLLRKLAVSRHTYFIELHAGVVLLGGGVVLLPGSTGRGKTTLTAALVGSGARYFSDEIALLELESLDVRPMPLAMTIKPGSVEPLRSFYPELMTLAEHIREDRQPVRYLPPPLESRCPIDQPARPARWVVFPQYEDGSDTIVTPLSAGDALRRLLDESLVLPGLLDRRKVSQLMSWVRGLQFYNLRFSSLDDAVRRVRELAA